MNYKKGFTLIELLVVVAIIGVLASVILASLNNARGKGADSTIKSNLANIRAQAEIIYNGYGCYGDGVPETGTSCTAFNGSAVGTCSNATADTLFANPIIWGMITSAANANGVGVANSRCFSTGSTWGVAVQLKTGGTVADGIPDTWCVDSSGASKSVSWPGGGGWGNSITTGTNPCL